MVFMFAQFTQTSKIGCIRSYMHRIVRSSRWDCWWIPAWWTRAVFPGLEDIVHEFENPCLFCTMSGMYLRLAVICLLVWVCDRASYLCCLCVSRVNEAANSKSSMYRSDWHMINSDVLACQAGLQEDHQPCQKKVWCVAAAALLRKPFDLAGVVGPWLEICKGVFIGGRTWKQLNL